MSVSRILIEFDDKCPIRYVDMRPEFDLVFVQTDEWKPPITTTIGELKDMFARVAASKRDTP